MTDWKTRFSDFPDRWEAFLVRMEARVYGDAGINIVMGLVAWPLFYYGATRAVADGIDQEKKFWSILFAGAIVYSVFQLLLILPTGFSFYIPSNVRAQYAASRLPRGRIFIAAFASILFCACAISFIITWFDEQGWTALDHPSPLPADASKAAIVLWFAQLSAGHAPAYIATVLLNLLLFNLFVYLWSLDPRARGLQVHPLRRFYLPEIAIALGVRSLLRPTLWLFIWDYYRTFVQDSFRSAVFILIAFDVMIAIALIALYRLVMARWDQRRMPWLAAKLPPASPPGQPMPMQPDTRD